LKKEMAVYRETDGDLIRDYPLQVGPILRKHTDKALVEIVTTKAYGCAFFLDNQLQLTEKDERIYHEMLVHPALALTPFRDSVCILGGGDGCAVREVLKWPEVKQVTLIDWDKEVTDLFTGLYSDLNEKALQDPRVTVENRDVRELVSENRSYGCLCIDLIDLDMSDQSHRDLFQLLMKIAYNWCVPGGAVVMNLGGILPWETDGLRQAADQLKQLAWPLSFYKVFVPSFGREWVFGLATQNDTLPFEEVPKGLTQFSQETWQAALSWSPAYRKALGLNLESHF
jgi:spermidine synthase